MLKYLRLPKIFLMASTVLLLSGCAFPEFPEWTPHIAIPSQNKKIECRLVDKRNIIFECDPFSSELNQTLDGHFCTSPQQQQQIIGWLKKAYERLNNKRR